MSSGGSSSNQIQSRPSPWNFARPCSYDLNCAIDTPPDLCRTWIVSYASVTPRASDGLSTKASRGIMPVPNADATPYCPHNLVWHTLRTSIEVTPAIQPFVG